ncbi:hypothetical protein [Parendozoicomonas haliclonae]|uniref:Uncharacterized protein n=1 Tax=Parendozoicomonas haliclonae TaxID=1960125 RepID=A0A1X7AFZ2_9GAMM|nr:hypothetical protein [Parendozoicomonas haliclonae]SMA37868.1 hypothetical protein EHSB41UT_00801 [Parendozoicomonas haliclonae]
MSAITTPPNNPTIVTHSLRSGIQTLDQRGSHECQITLTSNQEVTQQLYISGRAAEGDGRVISHTKSDGKPLTERSRVSFYLDHQHSYLHLHRPGTEDQKPVDIVTGKYARNTGLLKFATSMRATSAALPNGLRQTLGMAMYFVATALMGARTLIPCKASLNDEVRLYQQFGEDWRHHPHVTFELDDQQADQLQAWVQNLQKLSREGKYPLTFKLASNNCHGFTREAFTKTGYPGQFIDYFDNLALQSRGLGTAESVRAVHGLKPALARIYQNFIQPWLQWKPSVVYQPRISSDYLDNLLTAAQEQHQKANLKAEQASVPTPKGCMERIKAYLSSGSPLASAERLQKCRRYTEAQTILAKELTRLEDNIRLLKDKPDPTLQAETIRDLNLVFAIAQKVAHKSAIDIDRMKKDV